MFKPPNPTKIIFCPAKNRTKIQLTHVLMQVLGRPKGDFKINDIEMICKKQHISYGGKKHIKKWFRASLCTFDNVNKKQLKYSISDKMSLVPFGTETKYFDNDLYFVSPDQAKEYLLFNYILKKHPKEFIKRYDRNTEIQTFTVTNRNRSTGDKFALLPHYAMVGHDRSTVVIYSCDKDGNGSLLNQHWQTIPISIWHSDVDRKKRKNIQHLNKGVKQTKPN